MSRKGDLTKQHIKEQAIKLFALRGFKDVTMKDICEVTELSRGGLYLHYSSTKQIFSEIIDDLMNAQGDEFSEKIEQGLSAKEILLQVLERYKNEMLDSTGSLSKAILEFYSSNQSDDTNNALFKQYLYSKDMWCKIISYGIQRGEFKNVNSEEIVDLILFSYQ